MPQYYLKMAGQYSISVGIICFTLVMLAWIQVNSIYRPSIGLLAWFNGICWLLQFWGHGAHERRAPALLTNLSQALLMGPLFTFLVDMQREKANIMLPTGSGTMTLHFIALQEALFALGWAPELQREVLASAKERIAGFDAAAKAKSKAA